MTNDLAVELACRHLPDTWRAEPFRRHATLMVETKGRRDLPLLSLASTGVIAPRLEDGGLGRQAPSSETIDRYWVVEPGDLVVNPMWLIGGGIGVSAVRGAVSPDYRVYRPGPEISPRYLHHLLRSGPFRDQYRLYTRADTTFDRRVSKVNFHPMPIIVPPLEEQRRIADFLDLKLTAIASLEVAMRRQLAILDERRMHTLDATWQGSESSPMRRLGYASSLVTSGSRGWAEYVGDEGVPFFRSANLQRNSIQPNLKELVAVALPKENVAEARRSRISTGDVLIGITGANTG